MPPWWILSTTPCGTADSTGTNAGGDALANQLYALPAYWESDQGMCSRSDSLGSIVVCPSLMLNTQDPTSRDTETKQHQEKDVTKETQEKGEHKDIVPKTLRRRKTTNCVEDCVC